MSERELFSEERSAEVVAASFAGTSDARLREVMTSLVRHLHAFVTCATGLRTAACRNLVGSRLPQPSTQPARRPLR